ncbi:hypothetical protein BJV74DRAFT_794266 [Russula compacta]|nr:hypothetical protein BJV74DRAFT_794266 [Russula compacta]
MMQAFPAEKWIREISGRMGRWADRKRQQRDGVSRAAARTLSVHGYVRAAERQAKWPELSFHRRLIHHHTAAFPRLVMSDRKGVLCQRTVALLGEAGAAADCMHWHETTKVRQCDKTRVSKTVRPLAALLYDDDKKRFTLWTGVAAPQYVLLFLLPNFPPSRMWCQEKYLAHDDATKTGESTAPNLWQTVVVGGGGAQIDREASERIVMYGGKKEKKNAVRRLVIHHPACLP